MKKMMTIALAIGLAMACAQAQSWKKTETEETKKTKGWTEDFEQAKKEAAALKQPIFAFFTGSDWCGWCMKLKQEALDTKEFQKFAADNLILFEADFPRGKKMPDKTKKQNDELAAKYGVRGYPTVFLLDAEGKNIGQTGYKEGGAAAYVKHLKELLKTAGVETSDKADAAKPLSPFEKAKAEREANKTQK